MNPSRASWSPPYGDPTPDPFDRDTASSEALTEELKRLASDGEIPAARALAAFARTRFPDEPQFQYWTEVLAPPIVWVGGSGQTNGAQIRRWLARDGSTYAGQWVVLDHETVLASGDTLDVVRGALDGRPSAIALHVHEDLVHG